MSGSRRLLLALAGALLLACGEPEKYEVPADIRPEDASFFFMDRSDGSQKLIVHLSRADLCKPSTLASGTKYVEVGVEFPSGTSPAPGTFALSSGKVGVGLMKSDGQCGFIAMTADSGAVTIESVSNDEIRGSFVGVSDEVDLRGSFVAQRCATRPICS